MYFHTIIRNDIVEKFYEVIYIPALLVDSGNVIVDIIQSLDNNILHSCIVLQYNAENYNNCTQ